MIKRKLKNIVESKLHKGKAIILIGARQVGKTTLLKLMFNNTDNFIWLNGDEIDFIEESDGKIKSYEFKWNPNSKVKKPKLFLNTYTTASYQVIHKDNFESFL
ncbi:MAG: AAA family ATPase [Melioribacteraceae bacterium]|nr:AAA family ATPase [Melioribacteraceae bacterium]